MTLGEAAKNINEEVICSPYEGCEISMCKYGMIIRVNNGYVFVLYRGDERIYPTPSDKLELKRKRGFK